MSDNTTSIKPTLVAIIGPSGSGKTYLCEQLAKNYPEYFVVLSQDHYYHCQTHVPIEERMKKNYDHPETIEDGLLLEHVMSLKSGQTINVPYYDFSQHDRCAHGHQLKPHPVILLEGCLLGCWPKIMAQCDISIYLDTDYDLCLARRVLRDMQERGRDPRGIVLQYLDMVRPMMKHFVEPSKDKVDHIFHGGQDRMNLSTAIDLLIKPQITDSHIL